MSPEVKRLKLDGMHRGNRGWGMNPLRIAGAGAEAAPGMHLVSIRPGSVRGNHAHANATEWIVVFGGPGKITWRSSADGSLCEAGFGEQEPVLFEIRPCVEHAITNTSGRDLYALAFYDHPSPRTEPSGPLVAGTGEGGTP